MTLPLRCLVESRSLSQSSSLLFDSRPLGSQICSSPVRGLLHDLKFSARNRLFSYSASDAPASIKRSGFTALPSRRLLAVSGYDAASFLQGLTTANVPKQPPNSERGALSPAIYSAFLNAQGRILQDAFIYPLRASSSTLHCIDHSRDVSDRGATYLIEVDRSQVESLSRWLLRYKLRSKVTISPIDSKKLGVFFLWDNSLANLQSSDIVQTLTSSNAYLAPDTRSPNFGIRVLASPDTLALPSALSSNPIDYALHRYLHSLPEGPDELARANALIHDSSLDKASAVDFRKGCYVGQELVIRTQHTGVVRKRVLSVILYPLNDDPPTSLQDSYCPVDAAIQPGTEVWPVGTITNTSTTATDNNKRNARPVAKLIAGVGNVGLAIVRLELMVGIGPAGEKLRNWPEIKFATSESSASTVSSWGVKAFVPSWW
ncbi:MAG: ccr4 associated factor [Stictis urceolatum]|nr:ccr4 associated factor [Stictis urceolata]